MRATGLISQALRIAAPVALVVVTFGYAITGSHTDVLLGAGCGLAIGVGVGNRGSSRGGTWTGILIGSIIGVLATLLAGAQNVGWGIVIPPLAPLAVGLIDGLGRSSLSGYREVSRETFILSLLLTLGFIPGLAAGSFSLTLLIAAYPLLAMPWTALLVGLLSRRREGWHDSRPPGLLLLGAVAVPIFLGILFGFDVIQEDVGLSGIAAALYIALRWCSHWSRYRPPRSSWGAPPPPGSVRGSASTPNSPTTCASCGFRSAGLRSVI